MLESVRAQQPAPLARAWGQLACAIVFEIGGVMGLQASAGFTVLVPTCLALASFALALYLVSQVMNVLPVSIAYPVWAGGGTAGVAAVGLFALHEPLTPLKGLGILCVLAGVALVNAVSEKRSGC